MVRWRKVLFTRVRGLREHLANPQGDISSQPELTQEEEYQAARLLQSFMITKKIVDLRKIIAFAIQTVLYWILLKVFTDMEQYTEEVRFVVLGIIALLVAGFLTLVGRFLWYYCFTFPNERIHTMFQQERQIAILKEAVDKLRNSRVRLVFKAREDVRPYGKFMQYGVRMENTGADTVNEVQVHLMHVYEQDSSNRLHSLDEVVSITPKQLCDSDGESQFTLHPSTGQTSPYRVVMFTWLIKTRQLRFGDITVPKPLEKDKPYNLGLSVRGRNIPESLYSCWVEMNEMGLLSVTLLPMLIERQIP